MRFLTDRSMFRLFHVCMLTGWAMCSAHAQYSLTGTSYTQNFDTLPSSGTASITGGSLANYNAALTGWYFLETGSSANTTMTANNGSSTTGDSYSLGSSSDRALGGLQSGSLNPSYGFYFLNNTGSTITDLAISYLGETWRVQGASRPDQLDFQYSTAATSLSSGSWTDFNSLDYANPGQATGGSSLQHSTTKSSTISSLNLSNGSSLFIRWTDLNVSGSDDTMGVDDFSLTATLGGPPAPGPRFYFDVNDTTAGSGAPSGSYNWSDNNWSDSSAGSSANPAGTFENGNTPTFAAGTDGTGTYSVTVDSSVTANGLSFEEGNVTLAAGSGTLTLTGASITVASGASATISEPLLGSLGVTKSGAGTLTVSGAGGFSGPVSIGAGTFQMGASNVLPDASEVSLTGGHFNLNGNSDTIGGLSGSAGTVNLASGGTLTLNHASTTTFSGTITGSGNLVKAGAGTFNLSATNTSTGSTSVNGGTLVILTEASLGSNPGSFNAGALTLNGGTLVLPAQTINDSNRGITIGASGGTVNVSSGTAIFAAPLVYSGQLTKVGTSSLTLSSPGSGSGGVYLQDGRINFNHSSSAGTGLITVGPAADQFVSTAAGVTLANDISLQSGANPSVYATSGDALTLNGEISGAGGFTRDDNGSGTLTLNGDNTFTGSFTISSREVTLGHANAVGAGTFTIGGTSNPANPIRVHASLPLTGANAINTPVLLRRSFEVGSTSSLEFSGPVTLQNTPVVTVSSTASALISGDISGTSGSLGKAGTGTLTLTGSNSYNGNTDVLGGTLLVSGTGGITGGNGGNLTTSAGATFQMNTSGVVGAGSTLLAGTLRLDAGTLRTNAITMNGAGTFNWQGGALSTFSNAVLGSGSDVSSAGGAGVYSGRTLQVTGDLTTGPGTLLDLGELYTAGSTVFNSINITGSLDLTALGDTLKIFSSPYLLRSSNVGNMLDYGTIPLVTAASISGAFDSILLPSSDGRPFSLYTGAWPVSGDPGDLPVDTFYIEQTANQILLHYHVSAAIPEPSTAALALAGLLGLRIVGVARRRREEGDADASGRSLSRWARSARRKFQRGH